MRVSLSREFERSAGDRREGPTPGGSDICSGEATRDRLEPSLATADEGLNAIGCGPVIVFA